MTKSELMQTAWSIAYLTSEEMGGKAVDYISYGLKEAWVLYKGANEKVESKSDCKVAPKWFIRQNLSNEEAYAVSVGEWVIDRETEKAVHFVVDTDFGFVQLWCPKSILVDEVEAINYFEIEAKDIYRKARAYKAHAELVAQAKALGIKGVRKNMRSETLRRKIEQVQAA